MSKHFLTDYIKVYDDIVEADFCDVTIETFETKADVPYLDREQRPSFHDLNISQKYIDRDPWWMGIQHKLKGVFEEITQRYIDELDLKEEFPEDYAFEEYRIKKYENNGYDRFKDHVDVSDYPSARRFLVGFLYLNDVEEGGETNFPKLDYSVKPKRGRIVMFPPTWQYTHAGLPPVSSNKYIVGTYLHYK
tara:strand:+ start:1312 stop:1884 length:573 start_codon:yes stop_codon:yes gene_type:complete